MKKTDIFILKAFLPIALVILAIIFIPRKYTLANITLLALFIISFINIFIQVKLLEKEAKKIKN